MDISKHVFEKLVEASHDASDVAESIADLARSEDALIGYMASPYLEEFLRIQKNMEDLVSIVSKKLEIGSENNPLNNVVFAGQMNRTSPASMSIENAEKLIGNLGFFEDDLIEIVSSGVPMLSFYARTILENPAVFDRIMQLGSAVIEYSLKNEVLRLLWEDAPDCQLQK